MAAAARASSTSKGAVAVAFEVFGKVQGVFFRKHTHAKAEALGLSGWVKNTERGTVQGEAQGPSPAVDEFRKWLSETGSPRSRIDRAEFKEIAAKPVAVVKFVIIR